MADVGRSLADQVLEGVLDAFTLLGTLWNCKSSLGAGGVVAYEDTLKGERISLKGFHVRRLAHWVGISLRGAEDWARKCQAQSHLSVQ